MVKKLLIPGLIIAVALGLTVLMVKNRPRAEAEDTPPVSILVEVVPVVRENAAISVPSQGNVEARTRTSLVAEVTGQIMDVSPNFVTGGFFRRGEVLLQLDDQNYRAAVSRAESSVASAMSQYEQERGQADVAEREWNRMSEQQQSQVRAKSLYLRQPQLQEAQARLASAQADLEQAQADLRKTTIVAPYDGIITERNADLGQFINTGASIAEIIAVDYAEVRLPIPENRLQFLDLPGFSGSELLSPAKVELSSRVGGREYRWQGELVRTEGVLDTRSRVLFSVVQINDPYGFYGKQKGEPLRIGTFVNASIRGRTLEDVVVLPRHVLQANDQVWVVDQESRLRARQVLVTAVNSDRVYISGGFEQNDRIVVTRLENPLNGMVVATSDTQLDTILP